MSAGGYEAMHEAATEPGMFLFAGSYSGNIDPEIPGYSIANDLLATIRISSRRSGGVPAARDARRAGS